MGWLVECLEVDVVFGWGEGLVVLVGWMVWCCWWCLGYFWVLWIGFWWGFVVGGLEWVELIVLGVGLLGIGVFV